MFAFAVLGAIGVLLAGGSVDGELVGLVAYAVAPGVADWALRPPAPGGKGNTRPPVRPDAHWSKGQRDERIGRVPPNRSSEQGLWAQGPMTGLSAPK